MTFAPLRRSFFQPSAQRVAPRLLGHWLIRQLPEGLCGGPIVETEAYLADDDPASHAYAGQTARNGVMFGPPGLAYVYLIYGLHCCVNAVCHRVGRAEAVLIRAVEAQFGAEAMRKNRPAPTMIALSNGPAKLCAALAIDRKIDGTDLCDAAAPLFIARNPQVARFRRQRGPMVIDTRVGITRAAHLPLRFFLDGSPFISRRVRTAGARASE
ncbi:MAG TPA: DNA-3-methyladenine glycosylase [Candidatus Baltobacteraceae bacterium]|jgi:DNA-3-methyladenine glycosylase|nr:DNA-3-methyladenine glycosylase [Candidatus Baltobacteraceae bacterium]